MSLWRKHGRTKPYSATGIRRIPCFRCGRSAEFQWQICADDRTYRPLCRYCDIALNALVLHWMGFPDAEAKLDAYRERIAR